MYLSDSFYFGRKALQELLFCNATVKLKNTQANSFKRKWEF